jgi:hypothetical protein
MRSADDRDSKQAAPRLVAKERHALLIDLCRRDRWPLVSVRFGQEWTFAIYDKPFVSIQPLHA